MKINKIYILLFTFCIMFFAFSDSSYALTITDNGELIELPEVNTVLSQIDLVTYPYYHYIIYKNEAGTQYGLMVYKSEEPLDSFRCYVGGTNVIRVEDLDDTTTFYEHIYMYEPSTNKWKTSQVNPMTRPPNDYTSIRYTSLISSTVDIYRSKTNDEIFFQRTPLVAEKTLVEETLEMIAEETPKMAEETVQTMKIILLCGVGCLALLISLPLLLKVFSRYQ